MQEPRWNVLMYGGKEIFIASKNWQKPFGTEHNLILSFYTYELTEINVIFTMEFSSLCFVFFWYVILIFSTHHWYFSLTLGKIIFHDHRMVFSLLRQ